MDKNLTPVGQYTAICPSGMQISSRDSLSHRQLVLPGHRVYSSLTANNFLRQNSIFLIFKEIKEFKTKFEINVFSLRSRCRMNNLVSGFFLKKERDNFFCKCSSMQLSNYSSSSSSLTDNEGENCGGVLIK